MDILLGLRRVGWAHISWGATLIHGKQTLSSQMEQCSFMVLIFMKVQGTALFSAFWSNLF